MLIALREAATLLGRTERTLRDQLKRGEIRGKKENGRWWIERSSLPLTEAQRTSLETRAETMRDVLESALPKAIRRDRAQTYSGFDLDAFC